MIFDLFHSISDPVINGKTLGISRAFSNFLDQTVLSEALGFDTVWCAESHFSSETQKKTSVATIPHFSGEVGLNCDSFQLAQLIFQRTHRINFGTAIHNIVGGSGGPIASAERVRFLGFLNQRVGQWNRKLRMGVAAGRFPYQNTPFQMVPRDQTEKELWPLMKRYAFIEALEIFLRLVRGEEISSKDIKTWMVDPKEIGDPEIKKKYVSPVTVRKRWEFEMLKLMPEMDCSKNLEIVLGSHDPLALDWGLKFWDLSLFNLSFTSPDKIEDLHRQMTQKYAGSSRVWNRGRLPRTVMVFINQNRKKAYQLADQVLDNYIEAMRGTAQVPEKAVLLQRALVGDPSEVCEQMKPGGVRGFHPEDRLMLWFEFNQLENEEIKDQMKLFFKEVVPRL
ncbi:MAG: LLM class flavin-dependent oxidoreductase [Proteobacteria bacterium]|nr:LLM class flavin-dependent oxidoreductase [Pseudomonadota bacterium]